MTPKIKELLVVLDMPVEEQWAWITEGKKVIEFFPDDEIFIGDPQKYLADLAFRLRDEVKAFVGHKFWDEGKCLVANYVANDVEGGGLAYNQWFIDNSQPIHWIIAALIAKELAKEK